MSNDIRLSIKSHTKNQMSDLTFYTKNKPIQISPTLKDDRFNTLNSFELSQTLGPHICKKPPNSIYNKFIEDINGTK